MAETVKEVAAVKREKCLWILTTQRPKNQGSKELITDHNSFFFSCDCGNMLRISEDSFLCRDDVVCGRCEFIGRPDWEWLRKQHVVDK